VKTILLSMLLVFTGAAGALAQDAIVLVLTPEEAQTATAAADKLAAAQKAFDALKEKLLVAHRDVGDYLPQGSLWRFSTDFRALVPHWTAEESKPRCFETWPLVAIPTNAKATP